MRIAVFGLGYVGSVSCACLTELGHSVIGVDVVGAKVDAINSGVTPVREPGLAKIIRRAAATGVLCATTDSHGAVARSDLALVCVGTPAGPTGELNDTQVRRVVWELKAALQVISKDRYYVVNRSTCLPELHREIALAFRDASSAAAKYVVHPEFLREGTAVSDFTNPPLMVFGSDWSAGRELAEHLYPDFKGPVFDLSVEEAALIKYACNLFHAAKITFANEIGAISRLYGVDARRVMAALCEDAVLNISRAYLRPGPPFGGSCLPKDVSAIVHASSSRGQKLPLLSAILESNRGQCEALCSRILAEGFRRVALLGLAFKEGTDDVRNSPAVELAHMLLEAGAQVSAWDPCLRLEEIAGATRDYLLTKIPNISEILHDSAEQAVQGADAIVISQSLNGALLESLPLGPEQTVFDLVGSAQRLRARYVGLYWDSSATQSH